MNGSRRKGTFGNLRKNLLFLISGAAVLVLFLSLSPLSYALIGMGLGILVWMAATGAAKPTSRSLTTLRLVSIALTFQLSVMGFRNYYATWTLSSKLQALAAAWGTTVPVLLTFSGLIGCLIALYGMNVLACYMVTFALKAMKKWLPVSDKKTILLHLKQNWFFPLSALAFFCLNASLIPGYERGLQLAWLIAMVISSQFSSMGTWAKRKPLWLHLFSLLTTAGICLGDEMSFVSCWSSPSVMETLPFAPTDAAIQAVGVCLAAAGLPFVYLAVLCFGDRVVQIFRKTRLLRDIRPGEWVCYALLLALSLGWMCFCFSRTAAFYGTEYPFDLIYTSDSPRLVQENAYLWLTETENDLRQPLFAVFAAPFEGIPFLIGRLTGSESIRAMLLNSTQILLLYTGHLLLAKLLRLDARKRVCFMALISCTYTHQLFMLMMEQYIVAYFWLMLCLYLIAETDRPEQFVFWGAGGTLLTSAILLPLMSRRRPWKEFRLWLGDVFKCGLGFVGALLAFCRFDIFYNLAESVSFLNGFVEEKVGLVGRLYQYTGFIRNCFLAPAAGIAPNIQGHDSWQLHPMTGLQWVGLLMLALAGLSVICNRRKISARLEGGWLVFSAAVLLVLGWGTMENGLILYSLYFGWAIFGLLFQLAEKLEEKCGVRFLLPAFTMGAGAAMLAVNMPAIAEMLRFAAARYPA